MIFSVLLHVNQMDRTSILGDTIDYVKELLERINNLKEEDSKHASLNGISKERKSNEVLVRNSCLSLFSFSPPLLS